MPQQGQGIVKGRTSHIGGRRRLPLWRNTQAGFCDNAKRTLAADGKAKIRLRDNGPGIEEKNMKQLFDPFFTTKEVGEGTGLGLSICYRIIESHGGTIQVKSEAGSYTEFIITLLQPVALADDATPSKTLTLYHNENAVC